jgi:putative acyl-CoA dehydrogenase
MGRNPDAVDAFFAELAQADGADARLDTFVEALRGELRDFSALERRARHLVERLALALQGALLVRHGHPAVAEAFCASRLAGDHGAALGTLPAGMDCEAIIERARPDVG